MRSISIVKLALYMYIICHAISQSYQGISQRGRERGRIKEIGGIRRGKRIIQEKLPAREGSKAMPKIRERKEKGFDFVL